VPVSLPLALALALAMAMRPALLHWVSEGGTIKTLFFSTRDTSFTVFRESFSQ
jgi:hypothetical protein